MGTGDQLVGKQPNARDEATSPAPAPPGGPEQGARWRGLYEGGQPRETGIGTATVRRRRRHRRHVLMLVALLLAVAGLVAYVFTPRWWFSAKAYVDHLGYGPYEGEIPADLHAQLAKTMPGLISFVEKERGLRFEQPPAVVFLPDPLFRTELRSHVAFQQVHYVGGATYDALGWAHDGDTFARQDLDLAGTDVVSLYGDWDGTIYLRGHRLTTLARTEIVGLLAESLDDQTFNLAAMYGSRSEQDERTGMDALVAGDRRYVERAYAATLPAGERCAIAAATRLPGVGSCPAPAAPSGPIAAELRFADDYGLRFVDALRAQGGPRAVDAVFRHPPRSTADVMSIPHYRLDRAFRVVNPPPHAGPLVDFGTLGAYTLSLELADGRPARVDAAHEVRGWRGDSFSTYRHGGGLCVVDTAVFDTRGQARRFAAQARAGGVAVRSGPAGGVTTTVCH